MPITAMKNGSIAGFKYFGFGGLKHDTKGLKSFKGAKKGNKTAFNVFITPRSAASFKVNVWLNGPWDNSTWKRKKIGEILVPANSKKELTKFTIDVARFVEGLDKKHAIFLVAESSGQEPLSATSTHPDVRIEIQQTTTLSGAALVKCNYKGIVKTYKVVFSSPES